jgi:hypothetical protein
VQELGVRAKDFKAGHVYIVFLDHVIKFGMRFLSLQVRAGHNVAQPFVKLCSFEFVVRASQFPTTKSKIL